MVDTGAQHSVLNQRLGPMSKKTSLVQGATGTKRYCWTTERKVNLGTHQVSHLFSVIPECPAPLLGKDLLTKVNAQIHFDPGGVSVTDELGQPIHVLSLALRDEYRLFVPKPSETIAPDYNCGSTNTHWRGQKQQEWDWPNRDIRLSSS